MSTIRDQITRIQTNIANAYESLMNKGASEPTTRNSDNLTNTINSLKSAQVSYDINSGHLVIITK